MSQSKTGKLTVEVDISNIGGIDQSSTTLRPGVNVLTGKNATNRTSYLQAIVAACGSENVSLKADADQGDVSLTIGDQEYTRTLKRQNGTLFFDGDPYLDDSILGDLFAFLFENNEARRAVERGGNLREIIMRPVDTVEIEREIETLQSERDELDSQLDHLDSLREQLPELEDARQQLDTDIGEKKEALAQKKSQIDALDTTVEETREKKVDEGEKVDVLRRKRQEQQRIEQRLQSERESIESLVADRKELQVKLNEFDQVPEQRITEIDKEIQNLRGQIQQIDSTVTDLQSVIQFNEDFLDEEEIVFRQTSDDASSSGEITDQLLSEASDVTCWTCGSSVEPSQIESTLERLRSVRSERMDERQSLRDSVDELQDERSALESQRQNHEQTQQRLATVETEISNRRSTLTDLEEQQSDLTAEIERLESKIDASDDYGQTEILELQKEVSRLEVEIEQLQSELADTESRIAEIRSEIDTRERLEQRREEISVEIANLRTRIDDLQAEAVEEFNSHMDALLERLGYENLERIWIERTEEEVRDGRRRVTKDRFELHVVRSSATGTVYEDVVDHLSESEREITGLVFALAGYLVHDVYEKVPFMLLDSIEAIDSDRIARLVDYLADYSDYLLVALLDEDAQALDDSHRRIESI